MKKYAFFDIDYTIYDGYLASEFNQFMVASGHAVREIADQETRLKEEYLAGVIDYSKAARWALELTGDCLKGVSEDQALRWVDEFMAGSHKIYSWVPQVMDELRDKSFSVCLVSAAPLPLVDVIAKRVGAAERYGTEYSVRDGAYTGKLAKVLNYMEKSDLVAWLIRESGGHGHVAFGDSVGDAGMLGEVDVAFLYKPQSEELQRMAGQYGWHIVDEVTISADVAKL